MLLQKSIPSLRLFAQLEELRLPFAHELDLGFVVPWCGNVYMDDPTLSDRVAAAGRGYEKMVVEMVCKGLPTVKTLRFIGYDDGDGHHYDLTNEVSETPLQSAITTIHRNAPHGENHATTKKFVTRTLLDFWRTIFDWCISLFCDFS